MKVDDIIGEGLFYAMFITPLLAWLIVRKADLGERSKMAFAIVITLVLAALFFAISMGIMLRHGLGPDAID